MPPKAKKSVLLMVTNIGCTSLEQNSIEEEPFIDKAKYAMKLLIEKKIFLQHKDEIGIITMGEETSNIDDIENIKIYFEHLLIPNWEMVKYVNNLTFTNYPCNWIEALYVSLNFVQKEVVDPGLKIFLVIFNNFKENDESINQYDSDVIINELKNYNNIHLIFVGEKTLDEISCSDNSTSRSETFMLSVIKEVDAQYEQINNFIENRRFYIPPPIKPLPWKFNLEWKGIKIPCATYLKVSESKKLGSWKMKANVNSQDESNNFPGSSKMHRFSKYYKPLNVVKENITIDIHRNEVKPEKIINGYKFGGKYVPFSEEDEKTMKYTKSKKGMMVYGFVSQNDVKLEYWSGSGSRIIVPATNESSEIFYSFVQAMVDNQYAAVVRKVYANNNLPKMGILFPKVDDEDIWCLVHLEIPFVHDLRIIQARTIKSLEKTVDKEKLDAIENFINSMTISEDESIYLNLGKFPNIPNQYHWNALADRALNSETPLISLNNYLNKYLVPPEHLFEKTKLSLQMLNRLFRSSTIKKPSVKRQKLSSVNFKIKENLENIINVLNEGTSTNKNDTNEAFFSPEDVDFDMEELNDM